MGYTKTLLSSALSLILLGCGGGGGGDSTHNDDTLPSNDLKYVSSWVFPYTDKIEFQRQGTGDAIALLDRSLWYITGTHSSGYDVLDSHDITISESADNFSEPTSGIRSPYYMYIEESSRSFYIEPIYGLSITAIDAIEFHRENTGSLIALTNGSLWNIQGTHSSGYDVIGNHNITIYSNADTIPVLNTSGVQSDYYMHISGTSRGFYIEPLDEVTISMQDTVAFHRETTGDTVSLSDGSLWFIKGTHSFGYDVLDSHNVNIYTNVTSIPNPNSGERSDYYMYISGSSRGFFVEPL